MKVEISNGELVDKVTILAIKLERLSSPEKRGNVRREYELLRQAMRHIGISEADPLFRELIAVNAALWDIEDDIRRKEARQEFDEDFIALARQVYFNNDRRAALKQRINRRTGSTIVEEKEYADYRPR